VTGRASLDSDREYPVDAYQLFKRGELTDDAYRQFMLDNLAHAARHFRLRLIDDEPIFGWCLRSISAPVIGDSGACWLRVVSEQQQWAHGHAWTGSVEANQLTGVSKPKILDTYEWRDHDWRTQRAEAMTLLPGQPVSQTDVLLVNPSLPDRWWTALRVSLDRLATTDTDRMLADQPYVDERIRKRFGSAVNTTVTEWETVHGDLHWANVFAPELGIADWEWWGRGPVGLDAATLLCNSLLIPKTAETVRRTFADKLDTTTGRVAQLFVITRLLDRIDRGDPPHLIEQLNALAAAIIDQLT
jgi:hypothetical protein